MNALTFFAFVASGHTAQAAVHAAGQSAVEPPTLRTCARCQRAFAVIGQLCHYCAGEQPPADRPHA